MFFNILPCCMSMTHPCRAAFIINIAMSEMSVRLSVRLSNEGIVIKRKKLLPKFLYLIKGAFIYSFLTGKMVGGR